MISIDEKIGLAQVFSEKLRAALTPSQLAAAIAANEADGPQSPVCHTHDYCDSNECMVAAWVEFFGQEPDPASSDDATISNEAWDIAKRARFFPDGAATHEVLATAAGWKAQPNGDWQRLAGPNEPANETVGDGRRAISVGSAEEACDWDDITPPVSTIS